MEHDRVKKTGDALGILNFNVFTAFMSLTAGHNNNDPTSANILASLFQTNLL